MVVTSHVLLLLERRWTLDVAPDWSVRGNVGFGRELERLNMKVLLKMDMLD